eukprot:scaffold1866_cov277-Pinguiococcus_pyrenoidosus.AAC.11
MRWTHFRPTMGRLILIFCLLWLPTGDGFKGSEWAASARVSTRTTKRIMRTSRPCETIDLLNKEAHLANHFTLCAALSRIAKQSAEPKEARHCARMILRELQRDSILPRLTARQLSNLVWSTAKLGLKPTEVDIFGAALGQRLLGGERARTGEIAMALYAVTLVPSRSQALQAGFFLWTQHQLAQEDIKVQDVAIMVYSLARMGAYVFIPWQDVPLLSRFRQTRDRRGGPTLGSESVGGFAANAA